MQNSYDSLESFRRSLLTRSMYLIASINIGHSSIELMFNNLSRWSSYLGISAGICYLLIARNTFTVLSVKHLSMFAIITGIPFLSLRIWTLNGIDGSSAGWYAIFAMYAVLFHSQRVLKWVVITSIAGFLTASYFCLNHPYYQYSLYPPLLGWMLSCYVLLMFFYHLKLMLEYLQYSEAQILKQKNLAFHNAKLAEVGRLSGQIAHEVNTPLNTLIFTIHNIQNKLDPENLSKTKDLFIKHNQVIEKVVTTIQTLLKAVRGSSVKSSESIDPQKIYNDLKILLDYRLNASNTELRFKNDFVKDDYNFKSNSSAISQVLTVLLNNAIDALALESNSQNRWILLQFSSDSDFKYIDIIDSGHGIAFEVQKNLFKEGFSTKRSSSGNGIGLSIAKEVIESTGGKLIYIANEKNTHFQIKIACTKEDSYSQAA